ncbi:MAG: DeoR family transcriptional regulator [Candidatus Dormiibacterota bacterium]
MEIRDSELANRTDHAPGAPGHPSRDQQVLAYVARHGMVSAEQVAARFFGSLPAARRHLRKMEQDGLLSVDRIFTTLPAVVRSTRQGARLSGSDLPAASLDLARVRHSLALVDLSEELLAAHPTSTWTTERELRRDRMRAARDQGRWKPQLRVPDGLLALAGGRRVAIELDLTPKRSARLDLLAGAYAVDPGVDMVWWYLPSERNVVRLRSVVAERALEHLIEPRIRRLAP